MKDLNFTLGNATLKVQLDTAVKREDLYGRVSRIVQTPSGDLLQKGVLTQAGSLLPANALHHVTVDAKGSVVDPLVYERDGVPVTATPSSFKESRPLTPLNVDDLTTFAVDSVYPIVPPDELPPGHYGSTFNYRDSLEPADAILIVRKGSPSFLLVGEQKKFAVVGKGSVTDLFDGAEEDEGEETDGGFGFENFN